MSEEPTRILVVDDEPAMRAMAKAMLEALGHETLLANSGEEAVDLYHQALLNEEPVSMAIMDLTLPGGMSGVEALQELHELDGDLPVVATSGYLEENAYDICQQIGFVGVLPKPYTAEKLRLLVSWVISRRGIPGGYDEGMPRPQPPTPQKEGPAPEVQEAQVAESELEPENQHQTVPLEARIADRLSDLVDVAVAHRGAGTSGENATEGIRTGLSA